MTSSGIMETVEYRAVIRFLFLKGRTPTETFNEMKETYGKDAPSYDVVKHWHRQFKCGRTSVETRDKKNGFSDSHPLPHPVDLVILPADPLAMLAGLLTCLTKSTEYGRYRNPENPFFLSL